MHKIGQIRRPLALDLADMASDHYAYSADLACKIKTAMDMGRAQARLIQAMNEGLEKEAKFRVPKPDFLAPPIPASSGLRIPKGTGGKVVGALKKAKQIGDTPVEDIARYAKAGYQRGKDTPKKLRKHFGGPVSHALDMAKQPIRKSMGKSYTSETGGHVLSKTSSSAVGQGTKVLKYLKGAKMSPTAGTGVGGRQIGSELGEDVIGRMAKAYDMDPKAVSALADKHRYGVQSLDDHLRLNASERLAKEFGGDYSRLFTESSQHVGDFQGLRRAAEKIYGTPQGATVSLKKPVGKVAPQTRQQQIPSQAAPPAQVGSVTPQPAPASQAGSVTPQKAPASQSPMTAPLGKPSAAVGAVQQPMSTENKLLYGGVATGGALGVGGVGYAAGSRPQPRMGKVAGVGLGGLKTVGKVLGYAAKNPIKTTAGVGILGGTGYGLYRGAKSQMKVHRQMRHGAYRHGGRAPTPWRRSYQM